MSSEEYDEPAWLAEYQGLARDDAEALAVAQGRTCRVITPGSSITMDMRPDRLNIYVDDVGKVERLRAG